MKFIKLFIAGLFLTLSVGCSVRYTAAVYNVHNANVATQTHHVSQEAVAKAIRSSGASLGWDMKSVRPGYMIATLHIRKHVAKVGIHYTAKNYSINYISSQNLTRNGRIHRNYNGWIQNLDKAIKHNLALI